MGRFSDPQLSYTADSSVLGSSGIYAANLNGDRKTDLIGNFQAKCFPAGAQPRIASLLAKQSSGFYWSSAVSVSLSPFGAATADLNGDGKPDLIAFGNDYSKAGTPPFVWVYGGLGGGAFGHQSVVNLSGLGTGTKTIIKFVAVPLEHGALPSIIMGEVASPAPLQVLVNTTK